MFTLARFLCRATRNAKPSAPRGRANLKLESLEDRYVLSTLTVTSNADNILQKGTLRYAVAHADNGDRILITPAVKGAIVLTQGELLLNKDLTIEAVRNKPATISGNNASRVFEIASAAHVTLFSLTITHGSAGFDFGGGISNSGSLTINGCTLSSNAGRTGGAVYNTGTITISNSTLSGNIAFEGSGGGIYNASGTLTIGHSTLSGNISSFGGGIHNAFGTVTVTDSILSDNQAVEQIYTFIVGSGGGICNYSGTITIINSLISGNRAEEGGGILNNGNMLVNGSVLSDNTAGYRGYSDGGGILNVGTLAVTHSILFGNAAEDKGGGIYNAGTLTVTNSTILGNTAPSGGGADLFMAGGTLTNNNSVIGVINP